MQPNIKTASTTRKFYVSYTWWCGHKHGSGSMEVTVYGTLDFERMREIEATCEAHAYQSLTDDTAASTLTQRELDSRKISCFINSLVQLEA